MSETHPPNQLTHTHTCTHCRDDKRPFFFPQSLLFLSFFSLCVSFLFAHGIMLDGWRFRVTVDGKLDPFRIRLIYRIYTSPPLLSLSKSLRTFPLLFLSSRLHRHLQCGKKCSRFIRNRSGFLFAPALLLSVCNCECDFINKLDIYAGVCVSRWSLSVYPRSL